MYFTVVFFDWYAKKVNSDYVRKLRLLSCQNFDFDCASGFPVYVDNGLKHFTDFVLIQLQS